MATLTWRGAPLPEKTRTSYVNLKTKRIITNLNRRDLTFVDLSRVLPGGVEGQGPFITGPPEIIEEFYDENRDRLVLPERPESKSPRVSLNVQLPGKLPSLRPLANEQTLAIPGGPPLSGVRVSPPMPYQSPRPTPGVPLVRSGAILPSPRPIIPPPPPPILPLPRPVLPVGLRTSIPSSSKPIIMPAIPQPSCPMVGGSSIGAPRTTSVRDLSDDLIGRLCPFHLTGVTGEGKVTRIIDGDTIELLVYVPLKEIGRFQPMGRRKIPLAAALVTASSSGGESLDEGFFTILKCRLDGVDFAEKNTLQGREGTRLMTELYAESKNYVHYIIGKQDKYGRYLVRLYNHPDKRPESYLNFRYVDVETDVGVVAVSYGGGAKCEYMKQLPRIDKRGLGAVEEPEELVCEFLDPDDEFYGLDEDDI